MKKENNEIRFYIARNLLKHWQIANRIGIADATLSRWLRTPLTEERKKLIFDAIEKLKNEVS